MMLDADQFKLINDVHRHAVGNRVLVEVARRCSRSLRATVILSRRDGRKFIALLPNSLDEQARHLAERIRESISATGQVQMAAAIEYLCPHSWPPRWSRCCRSTQSHFGADPRNQPRQERPINHCRVAAANTRAA
jgi:GGDEF domain-containing protein